MTPGLFRNKALARISSPEQLDQLLRMSSPAIWLALAALAGLFGCALVWGFYGSLPTKVAGQGILLRSSGMFTVTAQSSGEVKNLYFVKGGNVRRGQVLAQIAQPALMDKVEDARSVLTGLKEKHRLTKYYGGEDTRLNLEVLTDKRQALDADIENLRKQISWYEERIKAMTPYVKDGTISKLQLFEYDSDRATGLENLSKKENERKKIESQLLELKNKIDQQLVDLENQITVAQNSLHAAMLDLKTSAVVVSPHEGRVVEVGVNVGSILSPGATIATLERTEDEGAHLEALLYFSPEQGQRIKPGMVVQVSPNTARQERYGSMLALVTKVSPYPSTQAELDRALQNPALVRQLMDSGLKFGVDCVLVPDHATTSGYKWSSSNGPDFTIEPGTLCSASVVIERQQPISLILPLWNKYVLGQGLGQPDSQP